MPWTIFFNPLLFNRRFPSYSPLTLTYTPIMFPLLLCNILIAEAAPFPAHQRSGSANQWITLKCTGDSLKKFWIRFKCVTNVKARLLLWFCHLSISLFISSIPRLYIECWGKRREGIFPLLSSLLLLLCEHLEILTRLQK